MFDQLGGSDLDFRAFGHGKKLTDIPDGVPYFFSIRQPVSRFVSGFYERKRQGGDTYPNPWSLFEASAFKRFEHANDLAEALFLDSDVGIQAREAIRSISHTSMQQVDHFARAGSFLKARPPLAIVRQEFFREDFQFLLDRIGMKVEVQSLLNSDSAESRITDYTRVPSLSALAVQNVRTWYVQDVWFYRACEAWILENKA